MKIFSALFVTLFFAITLASISDAEARRFGGKSSYSSPFRRSTNAKPTRSASQQKAYKKNQTARQSMSRRGGFMGILGGLALGGFLGSLFFGGAFENFNFMDILIFGGIAYLLFKLFAAKSGARMQASSYNANNTNYSEEYSQPSYQNTTQQKASSFDTDILFNNKKSSSSTKNDTEIDAGFEDNILPAGFDEADFLMGAKGAFKDLQKAWDNHDLAEIRGLTTDKVFAEIQHQLNTSTETNRTEILKVDTELLSIRETDLELEAVVLFDTIMRENTNSQAEQVREVWHFIKPKNSTQPKWYLDGIQQLEQ